MRLCFEANSDQQGTCATSKSPWHWNKLGKATLKWGDLSFENVVLMNWISSFPVIGLDYTVLKETNRCWYRLLHSWIFFAPGLSFLLDGFSLQKERDVYCSMGWISNRLIKHKLTAIQLYFLSSHGPGQVWDEGSLRHVLSSRSKLVRRWGCLAQVQWNFSGVCALWLRQGQKPLHWPAR